MNIIKNTIEYYQNNNKIHGLGPPLNLWSEYEKQVIRFEQFIKIFNLQNKSILDVGCGYGDLYLWLKTNAIDLKSYIGIDFIQEHCQVALTKLPKSCKVICGNFINHDMDMVDYSLLSGALNFYDEGWMETSCLILDKMWNLSKIGMAFNIRSPNSLDGHYLNKEKQIKDTLPSHWCSYAHNKTHRYALYHDYVSYDYTIAMWKY
jgi:SAM-dependent methyltransferase